MKAEVVEGQLQTSKTKRQQLEAKNENGVPSQYTEPKQKLGTEWATAQLENF